MKKINLYKHSTKLGMFLYENIKERLKNHLIFLTDMKHTDTHQDMIRIICVKALWNGCPIQARERSGGKPEEPSGSG